MPPEVMERPRTPVRRAQASPRRRCGLAALCAAVLSVILGWFEPAAFFHAYLFAAMACLNPALGCVVFAFIHRMTGGAWGETLAPALSAGQRMVPWSLLLCVPLLFGLGRLFPWAIPGTPDAAARALVTMHPVYFSRVVFTERAVVCAVILMALAFMARPRRRPAWTGPVGMILYVLTVYLLSVDWIASLEPGWHSTGFPLVFMASQALSGLALCIAAGIACSAPAGSSAGTGAAVWKDLGNLLLGALMFWAYVAYSQFLVVWSGNLPGEAAFYVHRNAGGWHYLLIALAVCQLFLPVLLLLPSGMKRRTPYFATLAAGVLLCQTVYLYWLIFPAYHPHGVEFHFLDILLPVALGCFWWYRFLAFDPAAPEEVGP